MAKVFKRKMHDSLLPYSGNLLREEIFANPEEIFAIFDFNLLDDFCD